MIKALTEEINILDKPEDLALSAAKIFIHSAGETRNRAGRFNVALSGGSTPWRMYRKLTCKPHINDVPWENLHLFWVDERCVPVYDEASNYGQAKRDMLDHVPLAADQIHPMPIKNRPREAASKYEVELSRHFGLQSGQFPRFDLLFLGVGNDGHTASLFPGQSALEEKERMVLAVIGGDPYMNRLTLTLPVINLARMILILVSGQGKADIIQRMFQKHVSGLPIQRVQPKQGKLIWLLDRGAASRL
jgi:6-phosphogluconolactonase